MEQKKIEKQLSLPLKNAVQMSFRNMRVRFGRAIIITMSILLGIAFLMSVLTGNAFTMSLIHKGPEEIKVLLMADILEVKTRQVWLVSLSLLVCTVGIVNAMLMSVTERSREIGTMKCLGALDKFIVELFLLESLAHGIVGSLAGCLIGILTMTVVYLIQYGGLIIRIFPLGVILKYMLLSILLGTFLAVVGALYPAYVSAKMEPAEAIRREV
ncbi:MAG: FtsX-like permease family protein [Candidatus Omnitrophica bacterium]|nr:FtsX-like permease family protein [Candidatus Omnitrophota bacterium]MCM8777509.1 FtsX-like permease family protein [Candidatus Omnitrophota bacterium]